MLVCLFILVFVFKCIDFTCVHCIRICLYSALVKIEVKSMPIEWCALLAYLFVRKSSKKFYSSQNIID